MTKLEELKAAYAAEPYGLSWADADTMCTKQVRFYDAAHNMMPDLLEAVAALETSKLYLEKLSDMGDKGAASAWAGVNLLLEKFK